MTTRDRPLSPHLQIYRWQWTMLLSIVHRLTGVALSVGTLLLVWWLVAVAAGPETYAAVQGFISHWFGRLVLFGFTWALFYHLANGIRHLFWDAGRGYALATGYASAWVVVLASLALTGLAWLAGYGII
ncbi:MAG TPA: succinate dehydrogenase, cytochrome b556 subunit [Alphaproteobacteria bacterium]|nr:succinate dehydrogenase, cytochrome b556 subunit [Alphaproteobacteria bacterium]